MRFQDQITITEAYGANKSPEYRSTDRRHTDADMWITNRRREARRRRERFQVRLTFHSVMAHLVAIATIAVACWMLS